jgi:ABC-2 type transport system permease protein
VRGLRTTATLTKYGLLTTLRTPRAVIFTLVFPVLLLVIFNSVFKSSGANPEQVSGLSVSATAYLTAGMVAYATALSGFANTVTSVTFQREAGQLKRLRGTPMPAWTFIAAQAIRVTVFVLAIVAIMVGISAAFYGLQVGAGPLVGVFVYAVLGGLTFTGLALAVSSVTTSAESAGPISALPIVLLAFISGVFIPVSQLGDTMRKVGDWFPLAHLASGMQAALGEGAKGLELHWNDVSSLLIWTAIAGFVAARRFQWEPRGR